MAKINTIAREVEMKMEMCDYNYTKLDELSWKLMDEMISWKGKKRFMYYYEICKVNSVKAVIEKNDGIIDLKKIKKVIQGYNKVAEWKREGTLTSKFMNEVENV